MKIYRLFAVVERIFRNLKNDKRTLAEICVAPVFIMLVFGAAVSSQVHDVSVVIVNNDQGVSVPPGDMPSKLSDKIISNLNTSVTPVKYADTVSQAVNMVENGKAYGVIIFPTNFTSDFYSKLQDRSNPSDTTVVLRLDKSNSNVADAISNTVNAAVLKTVTDIGSEMPISVNAGDAIYAQNARFIDFFVPGIMTFTVYQLTVLLTLLDFVRERTSGTLYRLTASPLKETEIVAGYTLAFSIVGMIQAALILIVAAVVFKITVVGNILLAFAAIALLAVVSVSLGVLLSSIARRETQAVQLIPFIILPVLLLSGIFLPVEGLPSWMRPAAYLLPTTYTADAVRSVLLKGWGLDKISIDIGVLLVFIVVFLVLAMLTLKRKE
ncbi:MAG TPA: ABC transporter permease [Candidatus Acidoferrales bacterium]|nr:ABC transporter permease [Candidatus Acidoferrales bacterium]